MSFCIIIIKIIYKLNVLHSGPTRGCLSGTYAKDILGPAAALVAAGNGKRDIFIVDPNN